MRLSRVTLAVAAGALAPALLLATPSFAAGTSSAGAVAVTAQVGSPYDDMDDDDLRVALVSLLANPASGQRVKQEINALLDRDDPAEMRAWLETGYALAQAEDDRVAIV
ncbi:hypothetical protein GTW40_29995, partial [Streptomyces sp. SID4985]|nr:hypothetical protein [Streptomyces sp. SID4985]